MKYSKEYIEMGNIGSYNESAFHGLKVYHIDEKEYKIRFMWFYDGEPNGRMTTANINCTAAGRPYFITRGHRIHLDKIVREYGVGSWI